MTETQKVTSNTIYFIKFSTNFVHLVPNPQLFKLIYIFTEIGGEKNCINIRYEIKSQINYTLN